MNMPAPPKIPSVNWKNTSPQGYPIVQMKEAIYLCYQNKGWACYNESSGNITWAEFAKEYKPLCNEIDKLGIIAEIFAWKALR